jgi:hypothetical protein
MTMKCYFTASPLGSFGTPRRVFPTQLEAERWARDAALLYGATYRVHKVRVRTRRRVVKEYEPAAPAVRA